MCSPAENSSRMMPSSANGSIPAGSLIEMVSSHGVVVGQRAERERAGDDADQDEADDRA